MIVRIGQYTVEYNIVTQGVTLSVGNKFVKHLYHPIIVLDQEYLRAIGSDMIKQYEEDFKIHEAVKKKANTILGEITEEDMDNNFNHRDYYEDGRQYEPRKVISDWGLNFNLGNAVKYISRAGRKKEETKLEDLMKAKTYLEYEIEEVKRNESN